MSSKQKPIDEEQGRQRQGRPKSSVATFTGERQERIASPLTTAAYPREDVVESEDVGATVIGVLLRSSSSTDPPSG